MTKLIKINKNTEEKLSKLKKITKQPQEQILEIAVEKFYRENFMQKVNKEFAKLKKNKKLWKEELNERDLWDNTMKDGFNDSK